MTMPIVFGLNYETAPFEIRERMAFINTEIPNILNRLVFSGITSEVLVLSTCNRTEIYMLTHDIDFAINSICGIKNICPMTIRQHSYVYNDLDCVRHLFRVASGLESMVLGETEIVAQIKEAFKIAKNNKSIGTTLSGLFQIALSVEKEVRNYTEINTIAASMGNSLVNIIKNQLPNIATKSLLFIGAGAMMSKIVPHFKNVAKYNTIVNRTMSKALELASKIDANHESLHNLKNIINEIDVIVTSCGSEKPILTKDILDSVIKSGRQILIVDISMPPITDLTLKEYSNITVLTIDDIGKIVDVGVEKRKIAAINAESLLETKMNEYEAWLKKRGLSPVIRALRDSADDARRDVLAQAQKQLLNGENVDEILNSMSIKLMNKLLHAPTVNLSRTEHKLQDDLINLINYLYDLEDKV